MSFVELARVVRCFVCLFVSCRPSGHAHVIICHASDPLPSYASCSCLSVLSVTSALSVVSVVSVLSAVSAVSMVSAVGVRMAHLLGSAGLYSPKSVLWNVRAGGHVASTVYTPHQVSDDVVMVPASAELEAPASASPAVMKEGKVCHRACNARHPTWSHSISRKQPRLTASGDSMSLSLPLLRRRRPARRRSNARKPMLPLEQTRSLQ